MLSFGPDTLQDPERAAAHEWLLPDGFGGYASSSLLGLNTRRQHGLLVVAAPAPLGRMVLLSKVEEILTLGGQRHELSANAYAGTVHPRGYEKAVSFVLDPLPTLTWAVGDGRLTRTVARLYREPAALLVYAYEGQSPAALELRPLLAYRRTDELQHENDAICKTVVREGADVVQVQPYALTPALRLRLPGGRWTEDGYWYRSFEYARDREEGREHQEDLFSHGAFVVDLAPGQTVTLIAWVGALPPVRDPLFLATAERKRLRDLAGGTDGLLGELRRASHAFLVRRGEGGRTVQGGYHWSRQWARDVPMSLPGLCLTTGRLDEARSILGSLARAVDGGVLPLRLPGEAAGGGTPTADGALWFVVAVERFLEVTHDREFVRSRLLPTLFSILEAYRDGTALGIYMTPDGLIQHGDQAPAVAAAPAWTAPEAACRAAPRLRGQLVEVQALWYNALLIGAELARVSGYPDRASAWTALAAQARASFLRTFWSEQRGHLADLVNGETCDLSLRPYQLFAIGLPHVVIPRDKAVAVLSAVRRELLTPVGLRTLARTEPGYRGLCSGTAAEREWAAQQGGVWPGFMGVYFDALVRVYGEEGKRAAREWLNAFTIHLEEAGLGYVSEVFDGDAPHRPAGVIAHAWNVAELLRVASRLPTRLPAQSLRA